MPRPLRQPPQPHSEGWCTAPCIAVAHVHRCLFAGSSCCSGQRPAASQQIPTLLQLLQALGPVQEELRVQGHQQLLWETYVGFSWPRRSFNLKVSQLRCCCCYSEPDNSLSHGGCPVHRGMFSRVTSLYSLNLGGDPHSSCVTGQTL